MLIDRPENTWSSNIGVSYAASARTSMRLEWVGWTPVSDLKTLGYDNSNLTVQRHGIVLSRLPWAMRGSPLRPPRRTLRLHFESRKQSRGLDLSLAVAVRGF